MLDLYLISDATKTPNSPKEELVKYLDGLNHSEFSDLQRNNFIENELDFYSDFRWNSLEVEIKLKLLKENESLSTTIQKFASILEKAVNSKQGIIGFCD